MLKQAVYILATPLLKVKRRFTIKCITKCLLHAASGAFLPLNLNNFQRVCLKLHYKKHRIACFMKPYRFPESVFFNCCFLLRFIGFSCYPCGSWSLELLQNSSARSSLVSNDGHQEQNTDFKLLSHSSLNRLSRYVMRL
jgi:hypothetical protein